MVQQATLPCLKKLDVIKAYVAEKPIVNAGDQVKEDDTTIITTGEDNMAAIEIPQQEEIANLNQGGVNAVPKPTHSPSSSGGSLKSLQTKGESYQNQETKLSSRILGNHNDPIKDIGVKPIVNYAKKAMDAKVNPNLTLEDVKSFIKTPQIWRSLLSICNTVDDSLRLASPQVINSKLQGSIKKDTLSVEYPGVWDTPVSSILIEKCLAAFKE